jgi:hypothetical protein
MDDGQRRPQHGRGRVSRHRTQAPRATARASSTFWKNGTGPTSW